MPEQQQFDYAKLPDGSYAKFAHGTSPDVMRQKLTAAGLLKPQSPAAPQKNFSERIGGRLEDTLWHGPAALVQNLMDSLAGKRTQEDKDLGEKTVFPWGREGLPGAAGVLTAGPRAVYNQVAPMIADWLKDPANAVADIGTMAIGGEGKIPKAAEVEGRIPRPKPTAEIPLRPEQQASYTAAIDKTNTEYATKLKGYHEQLNKLFDEAKRQQTEGKTAAEREHLHEMTKTFDEAKREQHEAVGKHAETTSKVEAANAEKLAKYEQKVSEVRRGQTLTGYQKRYSQIIKNMVDRTHENTRNYLNSRWDALREKNKGQMLNSVKISHVINEAQSMLAGQPEDLKIFKDIMKQVSTGDSVDAGGEQLATVVRPMTWQEGRAAYTALGEKQFASAGNIRRALGYVRDKAFDPELSAAATRTGTGKEYQLLKKDWSQYMQDWHDMGAIGTGGSPLARMRLAKDLPYIADQVTGKASERLQETIDRYKRFGGSSEPLKGFLKMKEQADRMAKKAPAKPELDALPTGELTIPEKKMPSLKSPEFPEKALPTPPQIKAVPRPKPKVHRASALARHVGAIAGAMSGGVLGHPLVGAGIGRDIADRLAEIKRGLEPPPQ